NVAQRSSALTLWALEKRKGAARDCSRRPLTSPTCGELVWLVLFLDDPDLDRGVDAAAQLDADLGHAERLERLVEHDLLRVDGKPPRLPRPRGVRAWDRAASHVL